MQTTPLTGRSSDSALWPRTGALQKVVIVNSGSEIPDVADGVLEAGHFDIVFVESSTHAYSQIRRIQPDLVILCLAFDDLKGYQVLSMLKLDRATRDIPVLTYASEQASEEPDVESGEDAESTEFFGQQADEPMN